MNLNELRSQIDDLDEQIIALLTKRLQIAQKIGKIKKETSSTPLCDPKREAEILEKISQRVDNPKLKLNLIKIYQEILNESKAAQKIIIQNKNY